MKDLSVSTTSFQDDKSIGISDYSASDFFDLYWFLANKIFIYFLQATDTQV